MLQKNKKIIQKNKTSKSQKKMTGQEKNIRQGQERMDAEGGNRGKESKRLAL